MDVAEAEIFETLTLCKFWVLTKILNAPTRILFGTLLKNIKYSEGVDDLSAHVFYFFTGWTVQLLDTTQKKDEANKKYHKIGKKTYLSV